MNKHKFATTPNFDTKANEIVLGAVDATGLQFTLEKYITSIDVHEAHAPWLVIFGDNNATSIVKVKARAMRPFLRGDFRGGCERGLGIRIRRTAATGALEVATDGMVGVVPKGIVGEVVCGN